MVKLKALTTMAKKEFEQLKKRIELLEMQLKDLQKVDPDVIDQRFKSKPVFATCCVSICFN